MADLMPHRVEACGLDDMDDGTAHVIIDTQLEELEALPDTSDPDTLLARETYEIELKRSRGMRPYNPTAELVQSEGARDIGGVTVATEQGKCMAYSLSKPSSANN